MKGILQHRCIASFMLLAFLVHSLIPFYAVYNLPQISDETSTEAPEELASFFGDKILICTSDGFQWVTWDELKNRKHAPEPHSDYECALCYASANGLKHALTSIALAVSTPHDLAHANTHLREDAIWRPQNTANSRIIRAPPAPISVPHFS